MSQGRGNRAQRETYAAVREEAEAAGCACRLDCRRRGAEQHAIITFPDGGELTIAIHGTPRVVETNVNKTRQRARKRIAERLSSIRR